MKDGAKCPFCGGKEWQASRNDLGYSHFKADGIKPTRQQHHRCTGCGYIASFAKGDTTTNGRKPSA